jgi:tetratricopeptide (TPR) repeat protein
MMRFERRTSGAVLSALALVILALAGCNQSPDAKEAKFLTEGKKEFDKKNYAIAILQFKNASKAKPWDAEPHYQLGLSYLAGNDFKSAAADFRTATELNPKHTGAQLKLAELMATSGPKKNDLLDAEKHANAVLALLPEDPDALSALGIAELRLGNLESAQSYLERAVSKTPDHVKSWAVLAQVKVARKDVAGAENALLQACAKAPKSPEARNSLGEFYLSHGRAPEAERQFREALSIDPKNGPALMQLGAMQVKAGQTDQAEQTYRQIAALPEKQYAPAHAEFLFRSGKRDEAVSEFEKLVAADPEDRNLRTGLVDAYLVLNRASDAEKVLTAAVKRNGIDEDSLIRRSRIYLDWGKYAQAEADLNRILQFHKDSAAAYYLLAKVSEGRSNPTVQKRDLEEALRIDPTFLAARIDLAKVLLAAYNAPPALTLLDEAPEDQMNSVPRILERNWVLLGLHRKEDVRKGIDSVLAGGKVPEALVQDAALKLDQKDYAGARKSSEEALNRTPEDTRALFTLVDSYTAQKQTGAAVQIMREYALKHPASAPVQQYLGRVLARSGDRTGARQAFEAAKAANPASVDADFALAQLDAAEGKLDEARKRLSEVTSSQPDHKAGHQLLAQFEMSTGRTPAAISEFRKVVALDPKDTMSFNALAYLLLESKQPDEAMNFAQKAWELAPDDPAVNDTLGWIYYQKGEYKLAVVHLESADAKEGTAIRKYHLAMAYLKAGKSDRGRETLDAALKLNPNLPEAQTARQSFGIVAK